jgi:hypothetical protein
MATRRTPRGEHGVRLLAWFVKLLVHSAVVAAPLWMNVYVAPPSVDL